MRQIVADLYDPLKLIYQPIRPMTLPLKPSYEISDCRPVPFLDLLNSLVK